MTEIVNMEGFSFGIVTDEILKEKYLSDGNLEVPICEGVFTRKKWDFENEIWIEGATPQEILEASKPKITEEISRMKFEMQVLLTTGIEWDEIIAYIVALEMSQLYKKLLLIRLKRCVTLKREDTDLNVISSLMGITQEQLDEIFINGNLIE